MEPAAEVRRGRRGPQSRRRGLPHRVHTLAPALALRPRQVTASPPEYPLKRIPVASENNGGHLAPAPKPPNPTPEPSSERNSSPDSFGHQTISDRIGR